MKKLSILFILLFAPLAFAEFDGLPDYVKSNLGTIQKYPRASCVLLWCREAYTQNADGSRAYEWHSFRYLPDEPARDAWGDPHVAYVDGRQTLEILAARTYTRDGRQVNSTPENAFNPIVPEDGFDHAPDYSDFRQMVITMLGLENGSISELHYRITDSAPLLPWMEGRVYFREEWPVIARELVVSVPDGVELNYKAENGVSAVAQSGATYTWNVGEQAGYLKEDLAGHRVQLPNVAFTTAADWNAVAGEIHARIEQAMQNPPEIPASLSELLRGAHGGENKLDAIQSWVSDRFNVLELDYPDFHSYLRSARGILHSGYGNSLEMAVLVSALAARAGVNAWPLPYFPFEPLVPGLHDAAGWLTMISSEDGAFECDPLQSRAEFSRTDRAGGVLFDWKQTPPALLPWTRLYPSYNAARYSLTLTFDKANKDTLSGYGRLLARDGFAPYEKLRAGAEDYLSGVVRIENLEFMEVNVEELSPNMTAVDFRFIAPGGAEHVSGHCVVPGGLFDFGAFVPGAPLSLTKREFPQEIPVEGDVALRIEFVMPEGRDVHSAPSNSSAIWGASRATVTTTLADEATADGNQRRLIVEKSLHLQGEWLAVEHWSSFREWLLLNHPETAAPFVFKKAANN